MVSKAERQRQAQERKLEKERAKRERTQPTKFGHKYVRPEDLALVGPVLLGSWSVPEALGQRLQASGKAIPAPVSGALLIDTGATSTAISDRAAKELALKPVRVATTYGAHGAQQSHVYLARLQIRISHPQTGARTVIVYECEAQAIKDLEKLAEETGLAHARHPQAAGQQLRTVGLLGRDVLRHTTFVYDGIKGEIELRFDREFIKAISSS